MSVGDPDLESLVELPPYLYYTPQSFFTPKETVVRTEKHPYSRRANEVLYSPEDDGRSGHRYSQQSCEGAQHQAREKQLWARPRHTLEAPFLAVSCIRGL